jgi:hypothetical protein
MVARIRNSINHLILHLLLKCKYRVRRRPQAVRCIVAAEILCIKIGLIYYGRRNYLDRCIGSKESGQLEQIAKRR